jgi:hypothetical protein
MSVIGAREWTIHKGLIQLGHPPYRKTMNHKSLDRAHILPFRTLRRFSRSRGRSGRLPDAFTRQRTHCRHSIESTTRVPDAVQSQNITDRLHMISMNTTALLLPLYQFTAKKTNTRSAMKCTISVILNLVTPRRFCVTIDSPIPCSLELERNPNDATDPPRAKHPEQTIFTEAVISVG